MDQEKTKSALQSLGIQGSAVTIIGSILTMAEMSGYIKGDALLALVPLIGGVASFIGRLRADKKITSWF